MQLPPLDSCSLRNPLGSLGTEVGTSEPQRRRASASPLRSLRRPLMFAVRSVAPLGATLRHFRLHALPATRFSAPLRAPLAGDSEVPTACCRTPSAPDLVRESVRLCNLPTAHPHVCRIRKKGGVSASLRGVNSYSSKPCTTVSSVEESNAFAASVTGR